MFGYVKIFGPELKMKDYYKYKAYYCGLCRTLKEEFGFIGQMTLTYDMTFLIILLTSLYEMETDQKQSHCLVHPVKKVTMLTNEITRYVAEMNIVLSYHHLKDDWQDEHSMAGLTGSGLLGKFYRKIELNYPEKCSIIKKCLKRLNDCEIRGETDIDMVAGCFGELMSELFVWKKDRWEDILRKTGFYLGKFIYILDAYEDREKDIKKNSFNPLKDLSVKEEYEDSIKNMLTMMMAECSGEFEKLPCLFDIDILRNILYDGVWVKYNALQNEKNIKKGTLQ